jgi:hypothetical protein
VWRRLNSLVAALSARFAFRSDSQLMWISVVTGCDNVGVRAPRLAAKSETPLAASDDSAS